MTSQNMGGKTMENSNGDKNVNAEAKKTEPEPMSEGQGGGESASGQAIREIGNGEIQPNESKDEEMRKLKLASSKNLSRSKRSVRWNKELVTESPRAIAARMAANNGGCPPEPSNSPSAPPSYTATFISTISSVGIALLRWGNNVKQATKKAEDLAENTWQHLKTSPSVTDAALGRIAQGAKVFAEGGYDKIFRQTFDTSPGEELQNSFVCYLSTSAGPIMGVLYLSTSKLAYCSDNPMPFKSSSNVNTQTNTQWSYYKVIIPLEQLKSVNPSSNGNNRAEKYIQVLSTDSHEFWYMGFVNYEAAVHHLQAAISA